MIVEPDVILLAEDNDDHVMLVRHGFKQANLLNPLHVVSTGEEAIAYLQGCGKYANRAEYPLPSLILLDLKMPKVNGFEVLEWIRRQPGLKTLRVIVLTTSDAIRDVNRAYELGANSFLVKPINFGDFVQLIQAVNGYWMWLSRTPQSSRSDEVKQGGTTS